MKYVLTLSLLLLAGCSAQKRDPEKEALFKEFERDKVLVVTCSPPEGVATAAPQVVYRFRGDLVVASYWEITRIEAATPENVCSKLRSKPEPVAETQKDQKSPSLSDLTIGTVWDWVVQIWKSISRR